MKIFVVIFILAILGAIFLPIYNGQIICGITQEGGCWNAKLNLIEYLKYKKSVNQ